MSKKLESIKKSLENLKRHHRDSWDIYGSELCAGDMIRQEEELEKEIAKLEKEEKSYIEDPKYVIDD